MYRLWCWSLILSSFVNFKVKISLNVVHSLPVENFWNKFGRSFSLTSTESHFFCNSCLQSLEAVVLNTTRQMNFTAVWLWVTITDRFPFKKCFGLQIHFTWIWLSTHGISYIQRLMTAFSYFCLYNPVSSVFYAIKCFPSNLTRPNTIGHEGDFAVLVHPNGYNNIRKSTKVSFFSFMNLFTKYKQCFCVFWLASNLSISV